MKIIKFLFSGEFLFAAFILANVYKSALPELSIDLNAILFAWTIFIAIKRLYVRRTISKVIIIPSFLFISFIFIAMIGYMYSPSTVYGFQKLMFLGSLTLWSFIGPFILIANKISLYKFLKSFLIIISFTAVYVLVDYFTNPLAQEIGRVGANGANSIGLGRSVALGIFVVICLYILKEKPTLKQSMINLILIITFTFVVFLTGARMALISLVVCLIILFLLKTFRYENRKLYMNKRIIRIVLYLLIIPIILIPFYEDIEFMVTRLLNMFNSSGFGSYSQRTDLYEIAYDIWSNSIFFGDGLGSFGLNYLGEDTRYYPHNIILELAAELGIFGLIIFLTLLITPFILHKQLRGNYLQLCVLLMFIYTFLNANTTGDINDNRMVFTFLGLMYMHPLFNNVDLNNNEKTSQ